MAAASFAKRREDAEKAGLLGKGEYLKIKEGANRFRLISECIPHAGTYQGKRNFKWLCYVIDRVDGKVKPYFMPHKIYKQIESLQISEDYAFADVPMPYDLTIIAEKAGTIDVVYTLVPARKETPITDAEFADFGAQKTLDELQAMLLDKQAKDAAATPSAVTGPVDDLSDLRAEDIPF